MIEEIANDALFGYGLIFCRFGSALLFLPGLGESYVSARARLGFAIILSILFYPILASVLPKMPSDSIEMTLIIASEIIIGLFFGLLIRILQSVMHIAGMKIAFMSSLSSATLFDTNQSTQGSVIGGFLSVAAITLIFTSGLHQVLIKALFDTYRIIKVNQFNYFQDFAEISIDYVSETFLIAFKVAAPTILIGLVLYLSAGLMSRLMPTMQVFFVLIPLQVASVIFIMGLSISAILMVYLNFIEEKIEIFLQ